MRTFLACLVFPCLLACAQTLTIAPTYAPGTVITFIPQAPIPATGQYSVVWSASAGAITQRGVYTVPDVPDGTIVTVSGAINPIGKIATTTLTVSRSAAPQGPPGPMPFTTVAVATLPPGSNATAAIANGVLNLGIPAGAPGATGAIGVAGATGATGASATSAICPIQAPFITRPLSLDANGATWSIASTLLPANPWGGSPLTGSAYTVIRNGVLQFPSHWDSTLKTVAFDYQVLLTQVAPGLTGVVNELQPASDFSVQVVPTCWRGMVTQVDPVTGEKTQVPSCVSPWSASDDVRLMLAYTQ